MKDAKEAAKQIKEALEHEVDKNDPEAVREKILQLTQLSSTAASVQAAAVKGLRKKELEVLQQWQDEKVPASILSKRIAAECWEEEAWLTYAQRLSAGITHSIDGLRSVLSYIKSEMENTLKE